MEFRGLFPALTDGLVHLAGCGLGVQPVQVHQALAVMLDAARRGLPWDAYEHQVEQARSRFAELIGARTDQVALMPSASVSAYQVVSGIVWWSRDRLLTTRAEFPSLLHVFRGQEPRGALVSYVEPDGEPARGEHYLDALDERVSLVSMPRVTYRDGIRLPVRQVTAAAHAVGAKVLVDAYQAVGVEPIDVTDWDCDWLIAGTSKHLGGLPGLVGLYARNAAAAVRTPRLTGQMGHRHPWTPVPDWHTDARRLQTGTPSIPAVYAGEAVLRLAGSLDMTVVRAHIAGVLDHAAAVLTADGEELTTPATVADRGAHLAIADPDPVAVAAALARQQIAVAPQQGVLRIAAGLHTSVADVDALCGALRRYRSQAVTPTASPAAGVAVTPSGSVVSSRRE